MHKQQILDDIYISKTLSWILRHGAVKENITITKEGFVNVLDILQHRRLSGKCNVNDIIRVVENNDKKRFALRKKSDGTLEIKAVQGHSLQVVDSLGLTSLTKSTETDSVVHGTYYRFWNGIKKEGLSRVTRNHIHFAPGLPKDGSVISGMRNNCQIYIYINLDFALASGLKFYKSSNNVILSPGNERGFIEPKYFLKVIDAITGSNIDFNKH